MTDVGSKILIVDDDQEIRRLLAKFLAQHNYQVSLAQDGVQMRQQLAKTTFHLVILDLMLPGEDGLSLCRELRAQSDVPVIMLTACDEDTDRVVSR